MMSAIKNRKLIIDIDAMIKDGIEIKTSNVSNYLKHKEIDMDELKKQRIKIKESLPKRIIFN